MKISELREYSSREATTVHPREVAADFIPNAVATQALTRQRCVNGVALSEVTPARERSRGLGELVQVVY